MTKMIRLAQVTSGYVKNEDGDITEVDTSKAAVLSDLLEDLPISEPVVVFCRFHHDLDAVKQAAQNAGRTPLELSGRTNELHEWQAGDDGSVLAVQIQAGGVGIDLTRACYAVYYSVGYSLSDYDQSLARVHRPGQTRPVTYYHLVARKTVDVSIYNALRERRDVIDYALEGIVEDRNEQLFF